MRKPSFLLVAVISIGFYSCDNHPGQQKQLITNKADYVSSLIPTDKNLQLEKINDQIDFWQTKLEQEPQGFIFQQKIARLLQQRFQLTRNPQDIHQSDSFYLLAQPRLRGKKKANNFHALSTNAITLHEFPRALQYCKNAVELHSGASGSFLMLFDVYMETGDFQNAGEILSKWKNKNDFDYLIRLTKYLDYKGKLDSAIVTMEKAIEILQRYQNKELYAWAKTNLGEMYGHAGRIEESYRAYLNALQLQPASAHALKGIAWIAYAHDEKLDAAKEILEYLLQDQNSPEIHLIMAQIAEFEQVYTKKDYHINLFYTQATQKQNGNLYNGYLISLLSDELEDFEQAQQIARREITNRPTPQSYELLAWVHYNRGNYERAVEIIKQYVEGKTYEPTTLYHMGLIFQASGDHLRSRKFLEQAAQSAFELGPLTVEKIQEALRNS